MTTGDATNSPTAKANLSVMKNGSVGLVNMSRPPGKSGAIGVLRSPITSTRWTTNQPTSVPTTIASRLYRMRQRSSSRWSRNGISVREAGSGTGPPEREGARDVSAPQALQLVAGQVGLVRAGIPGDDPGIVGPRRLLVAPRFGDEAQLVQGGGRPRRVGMALHDLFIHRGR